MTNRIAIFLAIAILAFLIFDWVVFDSELAVFLARKFVLFVDYLKFWR